MSKIDLITNVETPIDVPDPLPELYDAPQYPLDALGPILGKAAERLAYHVQVPGGMAGQSVLAAASLIAQAHINVQRGNIGVGPVSIFCLSVAESGDRKSTVDRLALAPVRHYENERIQAVAEEEKSYKSELESWEIRREALTKSYNKRDSEMSEATQKELTEKLFQLEQIKPICPPRPNITFSEPTAEGIWKHYIHGQPSAGLFSDEGISFFGGHGMSEEAKGRSIHLLCKLWDGDPITRKGYEHPLAEHIKGSNIITFTGFWRASDNSQATNFPFLEICASIIGITIKSHTTALEGDLKVVFEVEGDEQIRLLSEVIRRTNNMTLTGCSNFHRGLIHLLGEKGEKLATKAKIFECIWQRYQNTGEEMPPFFDYYSEDFLEYLKASGHLESIISDIKDALNGKRSYSGLVKNLVDYGLDNEALGVSKEEIVELVMGNLMGSQTLSVIDIPYQIKDEVLEQLFQRNIDKARAFFQSDPYWKKEFPKCYEVFSEVSSSNTYGNFFHHASNEVDSVATASASANTGFYQHTSDL